jgi:hypothetical protein
MNTSSLCSRSE